MSDTPVVGKIAFSSVANPNTWDIGESKCLVFASPSEAKRAEELFSAMQRDITAALAKLSEVEIENRRLRELIVASLEARDEEAKAKASADNAIANLVDPRPELDAVCSASIKAGAADAALRAATKEPTR